MPKKVDDLKKDIRDCHKDKACIDKAKDDFVVKDGGTAGPQEGGKVFSDQEGGKVFVTDEGVVYGGKVF